MPSNTIDFNSLNLRDAPGHVDILYPELHADDAPAIVICKMMDPTVHAYPLTHDIDAASWEFSPAAALTAGMGVWAAACGAALYAALG